MDHPSQVFSAPYWRALEFPAFLLAVMLIVVLWYNRLPKSLLEARATSACNWAIIVSLSDSLLFVVMAMWLVFGIGTSFSSAVCSFGYWLCIFAYAAAKLAVSFFLVERARLVTAPLVLRRQNRRYLFNLGLSSIWLVVLAVMIWAKRSHIRTSTDGECVLDMSGGGPVGGTIAANVILEVYYSLQFIVPLSRGKWQNPALRRLALRSALVGLLGLASSVTNLLIYAAHDGHELSWVCLFGCTADTAFCAGVLCLLTRRTDEDRIEPTVAGPGMTTTFESRAGVAQERAIGLGGARLEWERRRGSVARLEGARAEDGVRSVGVLAYAAERASGGELGEPSSSSSSSSSSEGESAEKLSREGQ